MNNRFQIELWSYGLLNVFVGFLCIFPESGNKRRWLNEIRFMTKFSLIMFIPNCQKWFKTIQDKKSCFARTNPAARTSQLISIQLKFQSIPSVTASCLCMTAKKLTGHSSDHSNALAQYVRLCNRHGPDLGHRWANVPPGSSYWATAWAILHIVANTRRRRPRDHPLWCPTGSQAIISIIRVNVNCVRMFNTRKIFL